MSKYQIVGNLMPRLKLFFTKLSATFRENPLHRFKAVYFNEVILTCKTCAEAQVGSLRLV